MAEASLIGAGIVLLALLAAWALRMFKNRGDGEAGGVAVERAEEAEGLAGT